MSDGHMPHQYPPRPPDSDPVRLDAWADAIAWKCQACGKWINEFGPEDKSDCPIDWRNARRKANA